MRWSCLIALVLAGCGSSEPQPRPSSTPTRSPAPEATAVATPAGPWSEPVAGKRTPIACPASSSRAGWASRVRSLGGGRYVKLLTRPPRLATVDRDGVVLRRHSLGSQRFGYFPSTALACGRGGRLAVAWVESREETPDAVRLHAGGETRTIDSASTPYYYEAISSVALAFAPDGTLVVAYAVPKEVRVVVVSPTGEMGHPFRLGPASELSVVVAEIARSGRAIVAWTTIDGGEERNERRRIYAVSGRDGTFGRAQLVDRAGYLNISGNSSPPIALAVAPNGRALLTFGADRRAVGDRDDDVGVDAPLEVRVSEASSRGRFRASRRLAHTSGRAAAAIRSDGTKLVVFSIDDGLRAFSGRKRLGRREVVSRGEHARYPAVSFRAGRWRVEWHAGEGIRASTRG